MINPLFPNGFMPAVRNNSNALLQGGLGLLSGPTAQQQAALGAAGFAGARQEARQKTATMAWLEKQNPVLAQMYQQGLFDNKALGQYMLQAQMPQKGTDDMREYEFAQSQGYKGTFQDYMTDMRKAGATNVTVGGSKYGTIPPGYMLNEGQDGVSMSPIPGGPAAQEIAAANNKVGEKNSNMATQSNVVISAANRAREAAGKRDFGSFGHSVAAAMPWTDSAEVSRQVQVLKSQATIENLNAMRRQSETGGALGNVTEGEGRMLAAKAGALDPNSPNFMRDLDDYELTLLRVIHGYDAGTQIFDQTRGGTGGGDNTSSPDLKTKYGLE